jgi:complexin-2
MKKVQITQELFVKMLKYFYSDELEFDDCELNELYYDIKNGIDQKLDAISKRSYYTKYKTADSDEAKEQARQKYLDAVGMHKDFRY